MIRDTLSGLTPQQRKAVSHFKGPLLITAGPGTGKTRVIAHRAAYLTQKRNVSPENLLVVTFTNKAADELKDRIARLIGKDIETMQVSTIHSFCETLLQQYPEKHEYGRTFEVLDDGAQRSFIDSHLFQLGLKNYLSIGKRVRCTRGRGTFVGELIRTFNRCSEHCVDPDEFIEYVEKKCTDEGGHGEYLAVAKAYKHYLKQLREYNLLDFSGLQRAALQLLKNNGDVLKKVRNRYKFLLVDEYQDTNPIQDELFQLIANPRNNICVVGDDDQSIYRFRGATVKNFQEFEHRYPGAAVFRLEENFRSTEDIVHISSALIQHNDRRMPKNLVSTRGKRNKVVLLHEETDKKEAETAAQLVKYLKKKNVIKHYGDVAILFRSVKYHAREYLKALNEENIPYVVFGDGGFLERPEIQSLLYLINFVGREKWKKDKFPFIRRSDWWTIDLLKGEVLKLKPPTIEAINSLPKKKSLVEFRNPSDFKSIGVEDNSDARRLTKVLQLKRDFIEKKGTGLLTLFYKILEASEYLEHLLKLKNEEAEEALYNIAKLSRLISKFEKHGKWGNVEAFFWYLSNLPPRSIDAVKVERKEAVKIMTIHQAKGLEFPLVIVGSATEGRFPTKRKDEDKYPVPERLFLRKLETHDGVNITDQRRMFYVGLARAQDNLIIGTSDKVGARYSGPSRYIEDIGSENLAQKKALTKRYECITPEKEARERVSYSGLNVYLSCPFRYKLLYTYDFDTPAWYYQNYGKSIHLALETIHRKGKSGDKLTDETIAGILDDSWIHFRYGAKEREKKMKEHALKLLTRYVQEHKARFNKIDEVEKGFIYPTEEYVLTGKIDLLNKEKDGVEIVDFKTRSVRGFKVKDAELQLDLYALPVSEEKIEYLTSHMLEENDVRRFPWNSKIKERTKRRIKETCKDIADGKFAPRRNYLCRECEFKFACPIHGGER